MAASSSSDVAASSSSDVAAAPNGTGAIEDNELASDFATQIQLSEESFGKDMWASIAMKERTGGDDSEEEQWIDCLDLLREGAASLKPGELCSAPSFTLYDSMSAIELMDPKMDSGYIQDDEDQDDLLPIAARLELNQIPLDFSNTSQVIHTLLYVLTCEASYYDGHQCTQSLYLCYYLHPSVLQKLLISVESTSTSSTLQLVMTSYFASLAVTAFNIRKDVIKADIFEEEDFSISTFNIDLSLNGTLSTDTALSLLERAKDAVVKNKEDEDYKVLLSLLSFREAFLKSILQLQTKEEGDSSCLTTASNCIKHLMEYHHSTNNNDTSNTVVIGINEKIGRLISSTTPPRPVTLLSRSKSFDLLLKILTELTVVCNPFPNIENDVSFAYRRYYALLVKFSESSPNVISRSYLLTRLYVDGKMFNRIDFYELIKADMEQRGLPAVLLATTTASTFINRVRQPIYESLKLYCHHPARHRVRIQYMLEDWGVLEQEAAVIDNAFTEKMEIPAVSFLRYFAGWTMDVALGLMIRYCINGFELELYDPYEYASVLWYTDCLIGAKRNFVCMTASFMNQMQVATEGVNEDDDIMALNYKWEVDLLDAYRTIVRGICQFVSALSVDGVISWPERAYGTPALRFKHRFKVMGCIPAPAALSYEEFKANSDFSTYESKAIYESASECFKFVRKCVESITSNPTFPKDIYLDEVKALAKVAVANNVSLARMKSNNDKPAKVSFSYTLHKNFAWIKL